MKSSPGTWAATRTNCSAGVQASQFVASHDDQVCPAKWRPGAETLKPSLDLVGLL